MARSGTLPSRIVYSLLPGAGDVAAFRDLLAAYRRMLVILDAIRARHGLRANVVVLTELAYQRVRAETGLPSRFVTLGIRDYAQHLGDSPDSVDAIPLDEKLFSVKGPSQVSILTLSGRRTLSYRVEGYDGPWREVSAARLIIVGETLTLHAGVALHAPIEEQTTMTETILTRVGRIIAGASNAALDRLENRDPLAVADQALREIDAVIAEARTDLGRIQAEAFRIEQRRGQLAAEVADLAAKIATALQQDREDAARAGIARQIDLETQIGALDASLRNVAERMATAQSAFDAANAARRDAEHRVALLRRPSPDPGDLKDYGSEEGKSRRGLDGPLRAIDRLTGLPSAPASDDLDELDRLHRTSEIDRRLRAIRRTLPS